MTDYDSAVTGAVAVGSRQYTLTPDNVLYDGAVYSSPDAVVSFNTDGKGSLGGAAVQTVPYGGSPVEPVVSADAGYQFTGWDKPFAPVVTSMTVTALYEAVSSGFAAWIADAAYGLDPSLQGEADNSDGDLYNNLLEYAFALDPSIPDGQGVVAIRYEGSDIVLAYRVRYDAADLTVRPMKSSTMAAGGWSEVDPANIEVTGSGAGYTEYEATLSMNGDPVFLLLEVTRN